MQQFFSLSDIHQSLGLFAVCEQCSRVRAVDTGELIRRFGDQATIASVRAGLRCTRCEQRACSIRLVWAAGNGFQHRSLASTAASQHSAYSPGNKGGEYAVLN